MFGWRINLSICIYLDTRSTSATSIILSFYNIFIATCYPVNECIPNFTLPNVPLPKVLSI